MSNVKKSKKAIKVKEIEYGSTKKKYIDKNLEETLKKSGFERKPKTPKVKELPKEIIVSRKAVDPDLIRARLPRNIDSDIAIKPEKKAKKIVVKEERKIVDLPSHLEFEAPEKIEVRTGMNRVVERPEGAHYGDLPEEIDIVHEETKEEKNNKKLSFFQTLKQTLGFSDNDAAKEEDVEQKKEELKREIEKREGFTPEEKERLQGQQDISLRSDKQIEEDRIQIQPRAINQVIEERREIPQRIQPQVQEIPKEAPKKVINDEDEMGLEPIMFTDKKRPEDKNRFDGVNSQMTGPEVLDNEEPEEDSSIDILYSKPKKKTPYY